MRTTLSLLLLGASLLALKPSVAQVQIPTTPTVTSITTAANIGQTITIDGVAYKVSAKKVLATGVEHYTVKGTAPKAVAKYYLRTKNTYNPTVFTEAQFSAFYSTRKLSSFGELHKLNFGGVDHWCMSKDGTMAVFRSGKTNELDMSEFVLESTPMAAQNNGSGCKCCIRNGCKDCADRGATCSCRAEDFFINKCAGLSESKCALYTQFSYNLCMMGFDLALPPNNPRHFLVTSKPVLFQ